MENAAQGGISRFWTAVVEMTAYFLMRIRNTAFLRLPSLAVAVILTVCPRPFFLAVTIPLLFTVAHFFFEELHFTFLFVAFEGEINTLSFRFLPALRAVLEAWIFIFFILIFFLFVAVVEFFCSDVTKEGGITDELAGGI